MQQEKEKKLADIRYHWHSYVANGGFDKPKRNPSNLEYRGLKHWTSFLKLARQYLTDYPKDRHIIEGFVPVKIVKFLIGE